jgi:hypothetical protein
MRPFRQVLLVLAGRARGRSAPGAGAARINLTAGDAMSYMPTINAKPGERQDRPEGHHRAPPRR